MKTITQQIKLIALGIIVAVGASYAFAWTGPTLPPPGGNVSSPINVGTTTQIKAGNLVMNGLSVNAATVLSGVVQLAIGNPVAGDVLEASDASGTAEWVPLPSVSSSTSSVTGITAGANVTISPTSGTGNVTINAISSVVGGCYYNVADFQNIAAGYVATMVSWGKNVSVGSGNSCTCPSGYTATQVDPGPVKSSSSGPTYPWPTSLCMEN